MSQSDTDPADPATIAYINALLTEAGDGRGPIWTHDPDAAILQSHIAVVGEAVTRCGLPLTGTWRVMVGATTPAPLPACTACIGELL